MISSGAALVGIGPIVLSSLENFELSRSGTVSHPGKRVRLMEENCKRKHEC